MTEPDDVPEAGALDLDLAIAQLRERPSQLPVEVAGRMLERALAAPRPAELVRSGDPADHLRVSTVALVALLHRHLDAGLDHAAVRRVRCDVRRDQVLELVTVELIVEHGQPLLELADHAHTLVRRTLEAALGLTDAQTAPRQHVHVGDVTAGDPHLVDPFDEI